MRERIEKYIQLYLKIKRNWIYILLVICFFIWQPYLWFCVKYVVFLFICYMIFGKRRYLNKAERKHRSKYWKRAWFIIFLDKILLWLWESIVNFYLKIINLLSIAYAYFLTLTLFWQIIIIFILICILIFLYVHYYVY